MGFGGFFQPTHLLFILVIALLVLGPKRLPEVAKTLGRGLRDFKEALSTDELDWRHAPGQSTDGREARYELASQSSEMTVEPAEHANAAGEPSPSAEPTSAPAHRSEPPTAPAERSAPASDAEPAVAAKPGTEPVAHGAD